MEVPGARHNLELTELDEFLDLGKKLIFPGISWMRPFVWHPQTNPFPKTKVDRFNRKKPFLKMSDTLNLGRKQIWIGWPANRSRFDTK